MTSTDLETVRGTAPAPRAEFLGQATAVEQARAVAEVQAAVVVAQQCPRNVQAAIAAMRESCQQKGLAERAFYRFPRAGGSVTGESIHLARELARCWGNVQYGIRELRRDDEAGFSEMLAYAWDVQTNTRSEQVFVVPHRRDTKSGVKALTDLRDIYENNANNGSRRVRQCIFSLVPSWFVEEAKDVCHRTLQDGGGRTVPQRIADSIKMFATIGVTETQLESKVGRDSGMWTEHDLAQLGIAWKSIDRGEIRVDEEFDTDRVTVDEITAKRGHAKAKPARPLGDDDPHAADVAMLNAEAEANK